MRKRVDALMGTNSVELSPAAANASRKRAIG
jgi:hypothetical protein